MTNENKGSAFNELRCLSNQYLAKVLRQAFSSITGYERNLVETAAKRLEHTPDTVAAQADTDDAPALVMAAVGALQSAHRVLSARQYPAMAQRCRDAATKLAAAFGLNPGTIPRDYDAETPAPPPPSSHRGCICPAEANLTCNAPSCPRGGPPREQSGPVFVLNCHQGGKS